MNHAEESLNRAAELLAMAKQSYHEHEEALDRGLLSHAEALLNKAIELWYGYEDAVEDGGFGLGQHTRSSEEEIEDLALFRRCRIEHGWVPQDPTEEEKESIERVRTRISDAKNKNREDTEDIRCPGHRIDGKPLSPEDITNFRRCRISRELTIDNPTEEEKALIEDNRIAKALIAQVKRRQDAADERRDDN